MLMNNKPLLGLNVIDMAQTFPGQYCAMHLADMGARVIKIEPPKMGDRVRAGNIYAFMSTNRNKLSLALSLKKPKGREIFLQLLKDTDIIIESFSLELLNKLELDYESLKKQFPQIIFCHISGYGLKSPLKGQMGHDINFLALSGMLDLNGPKDGPPIIPGFQAASFGFGVFSALTAILAALYAREKTGLGQLIDISLADASLLSMPATLAEFYSTETTPKRGDSFLCGQLARYNVYLCKDNKYIALGALELDYFAAFLLAIKRGDLLESQDQKYIKSELDKEFLKKTRDEWCEEYAKKDVCLSPILSISESLNHPHFISRNMFVDVKYDHNKEALFFNNPYGFNNNNNQPPPILGEHSAQILSDLGFTLNHIQDLAKERVIKLAS